MSRKIKTLSIPGELRDVSLSERFFHATKSLRYADRLGAAGFRTFGDLSGLSESDIRAKARTTNVTWASFNWSLGIYGASFK